MLQGEHRVVVDQVAGGDQVGAHEFGGIGRQAAQLGAHLTRQARQISVGRHRRLVGRPFQTRRQRLALTVRTTALTTVTLRATAPVGGTTLAVVGPLRATVTVATATVTGVLPGAVALRALAPAFGSRPLAHLVAVVTLAASHVLRSSVTATALRSVT